MDNPNYLIVMAGGIGSRLWPFSRQNYPKQFHDILGTGRSLLQMTVERYQGLIPHENVLVVTNASYRDLVKKQLPWITEDQLLLEPAGRNTGPCIAYAGYKIATKHPEANVVVAPSDHFIANIDGFRNVIKDGLETVEKNDILLTLGIRPTRPDTGYGYIQFLDQKLGAANKVKTFTEKPELALAEKFLESGDFVWNGGIFLWNLRTMTKAFQDHAPDLHELFKAGQDFYYSEKEENFVQEAYPSCKSISIDYAIMEKADNVYTYLSDFGWSDLGTWKSLFETSQKQQGNNVIDARVELNDSHNNIIKSTDDNMLIVLDGVDDCIVAHHDKVVMICRKKNEGYVKELLNKLKDEGNTHFV